MTKKRRFLIVAGILAGCVAVVLGVLLLLPPRPGVTKANFDRIKVGMTRAEVEAIFGAPSRRTAMVTGGGGVITFVDWIAADGASASFVLFDGVVAESSPTWTPSPESISAKLRRWLRLQ